MCIQTFASDLAVEGFDKGVVSRFARPREVEGHVVRVSPQVEITRHELTALVNSDRLRIVNLTADLFQRHHNIVSAVAEAGINDGRELREDIDNRQNPDLVPQCQLVMHKIHGPRLIRR